MYTFLTLYLLYARLVHNLISYKLAASRLPRINRLWWTDGALRRRNWATSARARLSPFDVDKLHQYWHATRILTYMYSSRKSCKSGLVMLNSYISLYQYHCCWMYVHSPNHPWHPAVYNIAFRHTRVKQYRKQSLYRFAIGFRCWCVVGGGFGV